MDNHDNYIVMVDGMIVAKSMPIAYATILMDGIFSTFYNDPKIKVTIERDVVHEDKFDDPVELYSSGNSDIERLRKKLDYAREGCFG